MSANLLPSQITKSQRWDKLYRIIHHLFLKHEFVHIDDYNKMVKEMNARIQMVEANANASIAAAVAALQATIIGHFHPAPQAPAGIIPTGPGVIVAPAIVTPPPPSVEVVPVTIAMEREDAKLMAKGPALAPLAGGVHPDQSLAEITIRSDIGF